MENTHRDDLRIIDTNVDIDIVELLQLFDVATLKLTQCAEHRPGADQHLDAKISQTELQYAKLQEQILKLAGKMPIRTENDIKGLLKLWLKERQSYAEDINTADQLVLALCTHYNLE